MIFLIEYDRAEGAIVNLKSFSDDDSDLASKERLALEIKLLSERVVREVVVLQASSLDALKLTHNRYFQNVGQLAQTGTNLFKN